MEDVEAETEESVLPKSIVVLASMKFVCALFYMGVGLFVSDYVINEMQIGTSAAVGTMQSLASLLGMFASMFVFVFLLEQLVHAVVLNSALGAALQGNIWLYGLYGGLMV